MSSKGDLAVELSASYAHRAGDDIRVVLQLADASAAGEHVQLQLRAGKRVVRAEATSTTGADGATFDARFPAAALRPGVWRLVLVNGQDRGVEIEARLLNSRKQPVALLPGPVPRTELPAPRPTAAEVSGRARAYQAAARVVNRGLGLLPEPRATRYRSALRGVARRIL